MDARICSDCFGPRAGAGAMIALFVEITSEVFCEEDLVSWPASEEFISILH